MDRRGVAAVGRMVATKAEWEARVDRAQKAASWAEAVVAEATTAYTERAEERNARRAEVAEERSIVVGEVVVTSPRSLHAYSLTQTTTRAQ